PAVNWFMPYSTRWKRGVQGRKRSRGAIAIIIRRARGRLKPPRRFDSAVAPSLCRPAMALEHRTVATNGINLHCAVDGDGPLVILLHGFPECWYSWRHQIAALAPRFRAVAPDLRGYNLSDKPPDVAA